MAKDYFQDIVPPANGGQHRPASSPHTSHGSGTPIPIRTHTASPSYGSAAHDSGVAAPAFASEPGERSIRNITAPRSRHQSASDIRDVREVPGVGMGMPHRPRSSRRWMWVAAGVSIAVLAVLLFVALRPTTVTVVPRSHAVSFDESSQFIASPEATAATGTLSYTTEISDIEDSQVVPSQGTVHAEEKASGMITVYNDYQSAPMRLVKTTRFETADGLIFRVPADIVIPGKSGTTPGQVTVTVIADKAGERYNVAPSRFSLPGLAKSASFTHVYAKSTAAMSGGFSGDRPGVAPGALESAIAEVRTRLEAKARESIVSTDSVIVFPDLVQITYQDLPSTIEAGGGVRIHERAHVVAPVFAAATFAQSVARAMSAEAGDSSVRLSGSDYAARLSNVSAALGTDDIQFTLTGTAQLIWNVDSVALAQALAGRDQAAFQTIVAGFPSIQEAHARIEPFWKKEFPTDFKAIKVEVESIKA